MAHTSTNTATATATAPVESASVEDPAAKALHKRYEGLMMVRNKAIKGKGAWYWKHLEPMLLRNADTGLPQAVKLRCSLCDAVFSASNPSRTATEHLKRGTCPNFNSLPQPISSISPPSTATASFPSPSTASAAAAAVTATATMVHNNRKRPAVSSSGVSVSSYPVAVAVSSYGASPLTIVAPSTFSGELAVLPQQPHLTRQEDLGALAMLEDSVKKLKSPITSSSPGQSLGKTQIDSALDYLADWVYESCGSVSFSSLEHPKFKAFLNQVGLPGVSRREFAGGRLDVKFEEAKAESEARIRDVMFFQIASDGWKVKTIGNFGRMNLVNLIVNLPNGTSLYRRAVFVSSSVSSKYAEEIFWETITGICGNLGVQQCVGIVADRFKTKALRNLENQNYWMVNLSCQLQGFTSLIKDFSKELPLFNTVSENCFKLATFVNNKTQIRINFHKYQLQEYGQAGMLRVPLREYEKLDFGPVYTMLEDILSSARALHLLLLDEAYKIVSMEDPIAREVAEMIRDLGFWNELEAVHSLVKLIKDMANEIETERPLVGQCLPLWEELRVKVKDWCSKFEIGEGAVEKVIERRFKKNYHPAWAAAYILDPLYLLRDTSGKYLPPFRFLTPEQEKDVDKLITRLVSREEAHIALMELMKWRTEGLDPVYARAVQMKERDPITQKMRIANPQSSRLVWETYLTEFKSLGKVAVRLIFLHATSCGFKCNWSLLRWVYAHGHSRAAMDKAQKLIFISAHSKLEKRDFSSNEDKDAELFAVANNEDDVLNEVLVGKSLV